MSFSVALGTVIVLLLINVPSDRRNPMPSFSPITHYPGTRGSKDAVDRLDSFTNKPKLNIDALGLSLSSGTGGCLSTMDGRYKRHA